MRPRPRYGTVRGRARTRESDRAGHNTPSNCSMSNGRRLLSSRRCAATPSLGGQIAVCRFADGGQAMTIPTHTADHYPHYSRSLCRLEACYQQGQIMKPAPQCPDAWHPVPLRLRCPPRRPIHSTAWPIVGCDRSSLSQIGRPTPQLDPRPGPPAPVPQGSPAPDPATTQSGPHCRVDCHSGRVRW